MRSFANVFISVILLTSFVFCSNSNQQNVNNSEHKLNINLKTMNSDSILLASGCFWCTEAIFQQLKGVEAVISGYSGGTLKFPSYEEVCRKSTGHAECIKLIYDTTKLNFVEILEVFFKTHNPTEINKQGNDVGEQYRSAIFYYNEEQKKQTELYIKLLTEEKVYPKPIVTQVLPAKEFYPAEDYHQNYYNNNAETGYCRYVIQPKLEKFRKTFAEKLKD